MSIGFCDIWTKECLKDSAIAPGLFYEATYTEYETTPETARAMDAVDDEAQIWPIHHALGWGSPSRFWQTRKPHRFGAGAFLVQETGEVWQIKPQNPRPDASKPGKFVKYETPKGAGSRAYLPPIDRWILRRICKRNRAAIAGDRQLSLAQTFRAAREGIKQAGGFWAWVKATPALPITITEGGKKSLSLLSQGYIAIALTGCDGGYRRVGEDYRPKGFNGGRKGHDKRPIELIPDLAPFAVPGRSIAIAFDRDIKPKTRVKVWHGTRQTARILERSGCTVVIARWDHDGGNCKGVDDLIAAKGPDAWATALGTARSLRALEIAYQLRTPLGKYLPDLRVNVPDLAAAIAPDSIPQSGIVVIRAAKGTAKTKLIAQLLKASAEDGSPVIATGHRESLQRGLGARLGLDYLHDTDRFRGQKLGADGTPTKRLCLCWDSILSLDPKDFPPGSFDLVLDEVDQGFLHLLLGGTCGKDGKRAALIARAMYYTRYARRVILASADITAKDIDLVASIRGEQPWILQNDHPGPRYPFEIHGSHRETKGKGNAKHRARVLAKLIAALESGERVWVAVDTLKESKIIEQIGLSLGIPPHQILRFDSETSGDPLQRSFADLPNQWLTENPVQLVICSPSLTSGVSIEGDFFDVVFGFFSGQSIAPWDCIQGLIRVRKPVPRIVYVARRGKSNGLTSQRNPIAVGDDLNRRALMVANAMGDAAILDKLLQGGPIDSYSKAAIADTNAAMADFGLQIELRLEHDGCQLITPSEVSAAAIASAQELAARARASVTHANAAALVNAETIDAEDAKSLRTKRVLSFEDRRKLERHDVCSFYEFAPEQLTIEAVLADRQGAYRKELRRLEGLLWEGLDHGRDRAKLDRMFAWGEPVALHDLPGNQLHTWGAGILGVSDLLVWCIQNPGWTENAPFIREFCERCRKNREDVKRSLGFTVTDTMTPNQVIGMVLRRLGLKTVATQKRVEGGDRIRTYAITPESLERAKRILQARAVKHTAKGLQHVTHPLNQVILGGVCQGQSPGQVTAPPPSMDRVKAFLDGVEVVYGRKRVYGDLVGGDLVALARRWGFTDAPAIAV